MPAETVYAENMDVRVAWGSDGTETVQLSTYVPRRKDDDDPTRRIIGIVNDWLAVAGEDLIDLDELNAKLTAKGHPHAFFDGYTAQLSHWASLNALIKYLKRARDGSFGRPE